MTKRWTIWTVFVTMFISLGFGVAYDSHNFLLENDFTYISFVNIALLVGFTVTCAAQAFRKDYTTSDMQWFVADGVLSLGMVGTLAGFLIVLYSTFQGLDVGDTESMKKAIETLATGMGTALLTSLVGLVASITMKFQLVTLEGKNV